MAKISGNNRIGLSGADNPILGPENKEKEIEGNGELKGRLSDNADLSERKA